MTSAQACRLPRLCRCSQAESWSPDRIGDHSGKTVIITGGASGIGFHTSQTLAAKGARVIIASRNASQAGNAVQRIRQAHPGAKVEGHLLDLADLASIRRFATVMAEELPQLDLLINNAGVMVPPYGRTADGFELQFGTNHLGHFALTGLLLPLLTAAAQGRIVTVSSIAHKTGRLDFADLQSERGYRPWTAYSQSKLANLLFAYQLQHRLELAGSKVLSLAAHPGWSRTSLQRHATQGLMTRWLFALTAPLFSQSAEQGSWPSLRAATDREVEGGSYYGPQGCLDMKGPPVKTRSTQRSHDRADQQALWVVSEELTGVRYSL